MAGIANFKGKKAAPFGKKSNTKTTAEMKTDAKLFVKKGVAKQRLAKKLPAKNDPSMNW